MDFSGEGVLSDEKGALEVVGAIDEDGEVAVVDVADDIGWVGFVAGEAEPEDVDGDSGLVDREVGGGTGGGVAAIAADDEGCRDVDWSGGSVGMDADDAMIVVFDKAGDLVLHKEVKGGKLRGLSSDEVEEVPLGHEGNKFCVRGEMGEVRYRKGFATESEGEFGDLLMGKGEEVFEDAELVHEFEGGGMNGVATEVAEEVLVLFEDGDIVAIASEEVAKHHAGRATTYDAATGLCGRGDGSRHRWSEGSNCRGLRQTRFGRVY